MNNHIPPTRRLTPEQIEDEGYTRSLELLRSTIAPLDPDVSNNNLKVLHCTAVHILANLTASNAYHNRTTIEENMPPLATLIGALATQYKTAMSNGEMEHVEPSAPKVEPPPPASKIILLKK